MEYAREQNEYIGWDEAEPYAGHDAPLTLRFDTRPAWAALRREFDVSETGAAIVLDLVAEYDGAGRRTSYSRRRETYASRAAGRPRWQRRTMLDTYARVVPAVDRLAAAGWIENAVAPSGSATGWQSTMRARPALVERVQALVAAGMPVTPLRPTETLALRDAEGGAIPVRETAATKRMTRNAEAINEGLLGMRLEGSHPAAAIRIFNRSLERGGRFYLEGGGIQVLPEARRLRLRIGGEDVSEVDYKAMHPTMLYAKVGAVPPDDPYAVEGWPRAIVKIAMLCLLNAPTWRSAMLAIASSPAMIGVFLDEQEAKREAGLLIAELKLLHSPIAKYFHTGVGAVLMREEADVMEAVMLRTLRAGEPVIPVHDSAVCRAGAVGTLEEAMVAAAEKAGIRGVRLDTTHA